MYFVNAAFSKNITILRKERKMTQKKVAEELGVSQALLSHYEKNIRECGLDFVVRMSEYYDVSCDFLLGVTEERGNCKKNPQEPPKKEKENHIPKCISSSLNIVFGIVKKINSKSLSRFIINYFSTAVYTIFRTLYKANENNSEEIFDVTPTLFSAVSESNLAMSKSLCDLVLQGKGKGKDKIKMEDIPEIDFEALKEEYDEDVDELRSLINYTEDINYYSKG